MISEKVWNRIHRNLLLQALLLFLLFPLPLSSRETVWSNTLYYRTKKVMENGRVVYEEHWDIQTGKKLSGLQKENYDLKLEILDYKRRLYFANSPQSGNPFHPVHPVHPNLHRV